MNNRVALITGASSGIGRATGKAFAARGAKVVLAARREDDLAELVAEIEALGGAATFIKTDVSDAKDVERMVAHAVDSYGRLDCAVNNAGIEGKIASILDMPEEDWDQVIDVNLKSAFLCSKYTIPYMIKQGKGSIINVASFVAFMGCTVPQDAYTASKGGMLSLTKSFAVQYGKHGIRCNAICPGPIETPLLRILWTSEEARNLRLNRIPLGRFGKAKDIVYMALYLASDESSWTTGAWLMVDGGISSNYF